MALINEDLISTDRVEWLSRNGVKVYTLRTDKIHPVISGNKWFKLKYYLQEAQAQSKKTIITFGGAYSNHIVATAAACAQSGLKSTGIIRGEEPGNYSHTLRNAQHYGMQLHFVSRAMYKTKELPAGLAVDEPYIIPEGGYGSLGAAGAATIPYEKKKFHTVCCALGTGAMMAGLINSKEPDTQIIGVSVLKNNYELKDDVSRLLLNKNEKVNICHDYHFGGYAKYNERLIRFMNDFYANTCIPTDFVYTAKLFFAVNDLIEKGYLAAGSILVVHCGGLQGNLSLPKGTLIF